MCDKLTTPFTEKSIPTTSHQTPTKTPTVHDISTDIAPTLNGTPTTDSPYGKDPVTNISLTSVTRESSSVTELYTESSATAPSKSFDKMTGNSSSLSVTGKSQINTTHL